MLVAFLDKVGGFFDRRFMVAFWAPFFLFTACAAGTFAFARGGTASLISEWNAQDASTQALLALGYLLIITVGAYLLQAFASPIISFYEGYWPGWMIFLIHWSQVTMQKSLPISPSIPSNRGESIYPAKDLVRRQRSYSRYMFLPYYPERIRPTRLGNVLTAAEEYAYELYGLDTVLWWPRLIPLLPEGMRTQIDAALTPLLALLNLSTLIFLLALTALGVGFVELNIVLFLGGGLLCLALSRMCYDAAVIQASDYGQQIRVAFDLYRSEILRQMRLPIPGSLSEEGALWDSLNCWVYQYIPPSETGWPPKPKDLEGGFQYASEKRNASPPIQVDMKVRHDCQGGLGREELV
jgi:hypothetical protein